MQAYGDNRPNRRRATPATEAPQPLDSAQLNAVMRNAFAWMTIGLGISAWVAWVLSASGFDAFTIMSVLVLAVILQYGLAIALFDQLRWFSPKQASFCFVFYSVVVGVSASLFFSLLALPEPSTKSVSICQSLAALFALMTLIGWKSKRDFSDSGSYFLMFLIGLPVAAAVHQVSGAGGDGLALSLLAVVLASALTAYMIERIKRMGIVSRASVNPDDAASFSVLAALKLYLSVSYFSVVLPLAILQWLLARRSGYGGDYHGDGGFSLFGDGGGDEGGFDIGDFGGFDGGD